MTTQIEWTDETWNPLTGCAHVSPGCDGCYAAREAAGRLKTHPAYQGLAVRPEGQAAKFTGEIRLHPDRLDQPLRWRKPRRVFVNSMSDLFHPDVPVEFIEQVWLTMGRAAQHTFQVLTKRPKRMRRMLTDGYIYWGSPTFDGIEWVSREYPTIGEDRWLPNVWLGTSIETDRYTFRADDLRRSPAAVRFLSLEPLLGPLPSLDLTGIDWVIVGGESGPKARPMHPDWVRDIRDQCQAQGVPFFFKQWGEWAPPDQFDISGYDDVAWDEGGSRIGPDGDVLHTGSWCFPHSEIDWSPIWRVGKKAAGRLLDGRTWYEMPVVGR